MISLRRPLVALAAAAAVAVAGPALVAPSPATATVAPASPAASAVVAAPDAAWPRLRTGDAGVDVRAAQHLLRHMNALASPVGDSGVLAVDGRFGRATRLAVVAFQRRYGLTPDGVIGSRTWGALVETVGRRSRDEAVMALQTQLRALGHPLTLDGRYGRRTEAAVADVQGQAGLRVDGVAGPATWRVALASTRG